jgi:hypothetical protein
VGLIAFPGSAGAAVPNCTPPTTTTNDSCVKNVVAPSNAPDTFGIAKLFTRTRTNFENIGNCLVGGCVNKVTLDYDNDFTITPGTIPTCSTTKADGGGQDIAGVWAACGPGAGTSANAYVSTQIAPTGFGCTANPCVSGQAQAFGGPGQPPVNACTLVFNGPRTSTNQPTVTLYARAPVTPAQCNTNPATNHDGTTNVVLKGTITKSPLTGFGKRLTVPDINTLSPITLFDFYAYVKRGTYFRAQCPAGASPWKVRAIFHYTGTGEPDDTSTSFQACS